MDVKKGRARDGRGHTGARHPTCPVRPQTKPAHALLPSAALTRPQRAWRCRRLAAASPGPQSPRPASASILSRGRSPLRRPRRRWCRRRPNKRRTARTCMLAWAAGQSGRFAKRARRVGREARRWACVRTCRLCFFGKPNSFWVTFMSTSILLAMHTTGMPGRYSRSSLYQSGRFLYVCGYGGERGSVNGVARRTAASPAVGGGGGGSDAPACESRQSTVCTHAPCGSRRGASS